MFNTTQISDKPLPWNACGSRCMHVMAVLLGNSLSRFHIGTQTKHKKIQAPETYLALLSLSDSHKMICDVYFQICDGHAAIYRIIIGSQDKPHVLAYGTYWFPFRQLSIFLLTSNLERISAREAVSIFMSCLNAARVARNSSRYTVSPTMFSDHSK